MLRQQLNKVRDLLGRVSIFIFDTEFTFIVDSDKKYTITGSGNYQTGRIFIQCKYLAPCQKTGKIEYWKGRKWYLSSHMTDDEVIKTAYCAFEAAVKHEIMEAFKVDRVVLFNPHINFEELLKISNKEIKRDEHS